jgi:cytoskeletal protein RodZ
LSSASASPKIKIPFAIPEIFFENRSKAKDCQRNGNQFINLAMSTVGEQLRQAREARGLTIQQAGEATKIRNDHIQALEEENYDVFSAPVYIRGFIRTYSTFLKLDTPKLIEQVNQTLSGSEKHRDHPALPQSNRSFLNLIMYQVSKVNWRVALPLVVALAIVAGVFFAIRAWKMNRDRDPLSELGPALYQSQTKNSGETLPLPGHR